MDVGSLSPVRLLLAAALAVLEELLVVLGPGCRNSYSNAGAAGRAAPKEEKRYDLHRVPRDRSEVKAYSRNYALDKQMQRLPGDP